MTEVADMLKEAREVVRNGWCRHAHGVGPDNEPIQFCMVGALWKAAGVRWQKEPRPYSSDKAMWEFVPITAAQPQAIGQALLALGDASADHLGSQFHSVPNFNDYYAKDITEVLHVYDLAVERAEGAARAGA